MEDERLRVLLIEHDAAFGTRLREMLGRPNETAVEVVAATDLNSALQLLTANHIDIAILELALRDGAGLATIPLLESRAPHVPIIVLGNEDDEAMAVEVVHAGAMDYLVKSQLNARWLRRAIRYAIERHHTEMAVRQAEQKYHSVFDHLIEGIFQTTPQGCYLMANAALARIYGYSSPEELMSSVTDIGSKLYVDKSRREEFCRLMQEQDIIIGFESQIYRKNGAVIWISENCHAIRDAKGNLLYYEGTVEDITQRRAAEAKLRDSEALYHSLVENLPQNIFRKDLQERFTFANQQFCRTLGCKLEDIVGKTDFDFFPPALAAKYQRDDRLVIETGQSFDTVEEHQPPDGPKMYVQVVKTPIHDANGQIIGLQGIFWDITEEKLAEEQIRSANTQLARSREELRARNQQMEEDLKMAREIQLTMLPQKYPTFPGHVPESESAFRFTHRYRPSGEVGGDFFALSALSDTEAAVFICDVMGHGVRSALVTAMICALMEELQPVAHDPGAFLSKLNNDLRTILPDTGSPTLTTAFYLVANCETGLMRYANAGHPRPLLARRQKELVEPLINKSGNGQSALGLFEKPVYAVNETKLSPGDLVILFTDGLYEVQAENQELYTQEMLLSTVRQRLKLPTSELFDEILRHVQGFCGEQGFGDDVCLLGVELAAHRSG